MNLSIFKNYYRKLSFREKRLIIFAFIAIALTLLWLGFEKITEAKSSYISRIKADKNLVNEVSQLASRVNGLESRLDEITTLYLNSSLTYEELTSYLDKTIKKNIGSDSYTLNRSKDIEKIGDSFEMQKFIIKINEATLEQVINLLNDLETGNPKMFIQRTDISKNRDAKSLNLSLELASFNKE